MGAVRPERGRNGNRDRNGRNGAGMDQKKGGSGAGMEPENGEKAYACRYNRVQNRFWRKYADPAVNRRVRIGGGTQLFVKRLFHE